MVLARRTSFRKIQRLLFQYLTNAVLFERGGFKLASRQGHIELSQTRLMAHHIRNCHGIFAISHKFRPIRRYRLSEVQQSLFDQRRHQNRLDTFAATEDIDYGIGGKRVVARAGPQINHTLFTHINAKLYVFIPCRGQTPLKQITNRFKPRCYLATNSHIECSPM